MRLSSIHRGALLAALAGLLAMAMPGAALAAGPGSCSGGTMIGGPYSSFTVRGVCNIAFGAVVTINGNLTIAPGASLNDHGAEAWLQGEIHVKGNIVVGRGAVLGLGWNAPEGTLGPDTVGGNIVANHPLALQIGGVSIRGNLISNGGGVLSTSAADFRNFPIKDNHIGGNLIVQGWHGGWIGLIRNTVRGNVLFNRNVSTSNPDGPGAFFDSSEVQGSDVPEVGRIPQTIGGNLICRGNVPAAHINPEDLGAPNTVHGKALGECAAISD